MAGVAPIASDPRGRVGTPAPSTPDARLVSGDAESDAQLADLIEQHTDLELIDGDSTLAAIAPGLDRRILKRLRKGEFPVENRLDLHGLRSEEAQDTVRRFIKSCRATGQRCVLIIHGRGHHSDGDPVLKRELANSLVRGPIARAVLAFTTALPVDGGAGAIYLLLRRQ